MNPNTKVTVRLATESLLNGDKVFGESDTYYQTNLDRIYVSHNIGKYVTTNIGRQDLRVGNGYFYDEVFEGAVVKVGKESLNAAFSRGHLLGGFRTIMCLVGLWILLWAVTTRYGLVVNTCEKNIQTISMNTLVQI